MKCKISKRETLLLFADKSLEIGLPDDDEQQVHSKDPHVSDSDTYK